MRFFINRHIHAFFISIIFIFFLTSNVSAGLFSDEEEVVFYNTYAYKNGSHWKIPVRAWVSEERSGYETIVSWVNEDIIYDRVKDFFADDESYETVYIEFDNDPASRRYPLPLTDRNGITETIITLSDDRMRQLLQAQGKDPDYGNHSYRFDYGLTYSVVSEDHFGDPGYIEVIPPQGVSIISDIDDTLKITGVVEGMDDICMNSFIEPFRTAPGMPQLLNRMEQDLPNAAVHYVTGSPWQFYRPLKNELLEVYANGLSAPQYPLGSIHMRGGIHFSWNIFDWRSLGRLFTAETQEEQSATISYKVDTISTIIGRFPNRKYILIGDSGEKDPEVYRTIKNRYPDQIEDIYIRDVAGDGINNPERLEGMKIIDPVSGEFEVKRPAGGLKSVDHQWTKLTSPLENGGGIIIAGINSISDWDPASVRIHTQSNGEYNVRVEEEQSYDSEIAHRTTNVAWYSFANGDIENSDGRIIGYSGRVDKTQNSKYHYSSIKLGSNFVSKPVVFFQIVTANENTPAHIRIRRIYKDLNGDWRVSFKIEEWMYQDGSHMAEKVNFVALEPGHHKLENGTEIEVGTSSNDNNWRRIPFNTIFKTRPLVFTQVQTMNESDPVVTRQFQFRSSDIYILLQEEEKRFYSSSLRKHAFETVGYLAVALP